MWIALRTVRRWPGTAILVVSVLASPLAAHAQPALPTIVFMTDFGVVDDSVALCKGVIYGIAPNLRILDLTHQVTAFSIADGGRFLFGASPCFPASMVFVGVVDPTVGLQRKAIVVKTKRDQFFAVPDNGMDFRLVKKMISPVQFSTLSLQSCGSHFIFGD